MTCCESKICHKQKLRMQKETMLNIIIKQITSQKAIDNAMRAPSSICRH